MRFVMRCCTTRFWDDYSPSARWMCLIEVRTGVLSVLKEILSLCMVLPSGVAKQQSGYAHLLMMQVGELKATFGGLKLDVEAMFMQMPSVDLDELGGQLEAMQHHQAEQVRCHLCTAV